MSKCKWETRDIDIPIDGKYPRLGVEVRVLLGWNSNSARTFLSSRMAARLTGLSSTSIWSMARGDRPKADTLIKFAAAFEGSNVRDLLEAAGYLPAGASR